jgi:hypothetical protein
VYSKKVEYLHNLVFRALETIHNKKQRERASAEEGDARRNGRQVGPQGGRSAEAGQGQPWMDRLLLHTDMRDHRLGCQPPASSALSAADATARGPRPAAARQAITDDLDEAFLALDEVALGQVAGEGDIDLEEDVDEDEGARAGRLGVQGLAAYHQLFSSQAQWLATDVGQKPQPQPHLRCLLAVLFHCQRRGKASVQGPNPCTNPNPAPCSLGPPELLRPPTTLLALEDAAAGQGEADGCYRLAQCAVHESGALLLELRDGEVYDRQLRSRAARGAAATGLAVVGALAAGDVHMGVGAQAVAGGDGGAPGWGGADDFDDDDGGAGWDCGSDGGSDGGIDMGDGLGPIAGWGDAGAPMCEDTAAEEVDAEGGTVDAAAATSKEAGVPEGIAAARQQRGAGTGADVARGGRSAGEPFDPYKPLDPNDKGSLLIKPLQARGVGIGVWTWGQRGAAAAERYDEMIGPMLQDDSSGCLPALLTLAHARFTPPTPAGSQATAPHGARRWHHCGGPRRARQRGCCRPCPPGRIGVPG